MTPREHHRFFAKQLIPTHTFQSPTVAADGLLLHIVRRVNERL